MSCVTEIPLAGRCARVVHLAATMPTEDPERVLTEIAELQATADSRAIARLATAAESLADSLAALLKLQLVQANLTRAQLDAAEEMPADAKPDPAAELGTLERAAVAKRGGAGARPEQPMELLTQTYEEIDRILVAHELAEQHFGRDKIPADLDLYAFAEEAGADQVMEQRKNPVAEPYSTVSPKPAGLEDEPDDSGYDFGGGVPV